MLPIERIKQIKELVQEKEVIKISELSNLLNVSEMTIHRDIKPLIDDGVILKTFGGIRLNKNESNLQDNNLCVVCNRPIHSNLSYRIILSNNTTEIACCGHCGLMREQQLGDTVLQSICQDFLRQTTLSAKLAWFVFDTSIDIGCCQPQVLTFEKKEDSEKFIKGFGGITVPFDEALDLIQEKMS
ncbi:MAG TPA: DeoR family transcriptional regulator [Pseudogracilibacillus sp.]|nr:DeoR family transcriptional regulator [Pseudogracilibacillus sp.]